VLTRDRERLVCNQRDVENQLRAIVQVYHPGHGCGRVARTGRKLQRSTCSRRPRPAWPPPGLRDGGQGAGVRGLGEVVVVVGDRAGGVGDPVGVSRTVVGEGPPVVRRVGGGVTALRGGEGGEQAEVVAPSSGLKSSAATRGETEPSRKTSASTVICSVGSMSCVSGDDRVLDGSRARVPARLTPTNRQTAPE